MKKQTSKLKIVLRLAVLLAAVGFYSMAQSAAVSVNLSVNDDEDKLKITTPGSCVSGNSKGCIKASKRTPVTFKLTGEKKCTADKKWVLDRVAIRGDEDGDDGSDLPDGVDTDFNVDMSSGVLVDENGGTGNILIRNYNSKTFTVWYRVYATCADNEIDSDPRMVNDGSGSIP